MTLRELRGTLRLRRGKRTAARSVGDKAIVIVIDENMLHTLNGTGAAVWERCDGRSLDELIEWFRCEYSLEAERAEHDVRQFVHELRALGALDIEGD